MLSRELRVAARRPRTYRVRLGGAAIALLLVGYFGWVYSSVASATSAGRQVFSMVVNAAFLYSLFAGAGRVADSLSSEKRQGTMGFLFLTPLRGADVVLGKLLAASLELIYALLATVPILGLCVILGGVQGGEFARTVLALFNTLFFSLAAGLAVSALCREERRAAQTASGVVVIFGYLLPLLGEYLRTRTRATELGLLLTALSPLHQVMLSSTPTTTAVTYVRSFLTVHALGWLALGLASWILPRAWQDRVQGPLAATGWRERLRRRFAPSAGSAEAIQRRREWLARNPFYWLAMRTGTLSIETWFLFMVIALLTGGTLYWSRGTIPVFVIFFMAAIALHSVLKMQVCASSCERIAQDKQSGTLEMLLCTTLSLREITKGQRMALQRQFGWPIAVTILANLLMLAVVVTLREEDFLREPTSVRNCVIFALAGTGMLALDASALAWIGMWQALWASNATQARSRALAILTVVPWTLLILLTTWIAARQPAGLTALFMIGCWVVLGAGNSVFFACLARRRIYRGFRQVIAEREAAKSTTTASTGQA